MNEPLTILIVDDSRGLRTSIGMILRSAGHRVIPSAAGKEALQILDDHPVDLVLTDVLMPEMDGFALIREIRRKVPDLPIVAMSGGGYFLSEDYCLRTATLFGATRVMRKPFDSQQLLAAVDEAAGIPSQN